MYMLSASDVDVHLGRARADGTDAFGRLREQCRACPDMTSPTTIPTQNAAHRERTILVARAMSALPEVYSYSDLHVVLRGPIPGAVRLPVRTMHRCRRGPSEVIPGTRLR